MEVPPENALAAELAIYLMKEGLHLPTICGTINRDKLMDWIVCDMYSGRIPPYTFKDSDVKSAINMIEYVAHENFKKGKYNEPN